MTLASLCHSQQGLLKGRYTFGYYSNNVTTIKTYFVRSKAAAENV